MKILIATGIYPPDIGGPATYSKLLKEELPKHGIDVEVLSFGSVRSLPKIIRHFSYFLKVLKVGKGVDIIYAQDPVSVGLPVCLASFILRKPFILKVVGDYAWEQSVQRFGVTDLLDEFSLKNSYGIFVWILKKIQSGVALRAYKIITPSEYLKKIVSNWGVPREKINVVHNTFTSENIKESKEELREKFDFKGHVIFSVGRLVPWKGFDLLIEIMECFPDIKLFIAGDGPNKEKLEKKIKDLKLSNRVELVGRLKQNDLLKKIKASDVFVLNTGYEGLSHQLLEVMSVGTPIVTTNVGGNPEVIENGKEGILVGYNKKDELKKAILSMLDGGGRDFFIENAKKKLSLFKKDRMIKDTIKTLTT